jgi:hypothetical protein
MSEHASADEQGCHISKHTLRAQRQSTLCSGSESSVRLELGPCLSDRYYLLLLLNVFFVFLFASSYWVLVSDAPMRVSQLL